MLEKPARRAQILGLQSNNCQLAFDKSLKYAKAGSKSIEHQLIDSVKIHFITEQIDSGMAINHHNNNHTRKMFPASMQIQASK